MGLGKVRRVNRARHAAFRRLDILNGHRAFLENNIFENNKAFDSVYEGYCAAFYLLSSDAIVYARKNIYLNNVSKKGKELFLTSIIKKLTRITWSREKLKKN